MIEPYVWIGFIALVGLLMFLDLGVFNRKAHTPTTRESGMATIAWVSLALLFNVFIYYAYEYKWLGLGLYAYEPMGGKEAALKFLTGYLLEEALSVDNLFVMALVFARFRVPKQYQHKVLFWGIIGVLFFRGLLIGAGIALVHYFTWFFYLFGALLLYSAYKMWRQKDGDEEEDLHDYGIVKFIRRFYPVSRHNAGGRFFVVEKRRWAFTPLFVALIVVETTDIMFAFDSVPAVFSITTDPFLVFSSNIFAILGLRSLYFLLANMLDRFAYLKYSMMGILFFIGVKMVLLPSEIHIPELVSLLAIASMLLGGILASLWNERKTITKASTPVEPTAPADKSEPRPKNGSPLVMIGAHLPSAEYEMRNSE
ncbi:MAG: TerC family protein [Lewinellaceae bacterium]|nr:TerC family protein [Saprospiraceae bacterium]MCB9330023.1 TerC family protein [Lewinellaceae bacterium]